MYVREEEVDESFVTFFTSKRFLSSFLLSALPPLRSFLAAAEAEVLGASVMSTSAILYRSCEAVEREDSLSQ